MDRKQRENVMHKHKRTAWIDVVVGPLCLVLAGALAVTTALTSIQSII